jgi:hypothetical protein
MSVRYRTDKANEKNALGGVFGIIRDIGDGQIRIWELFCGKSDRFGKVNQRLHRLPFFSVIETGVVCFLNDIQFGSTYV